MPTYDYRCKSCEHTFERFQPITADPLQECPSCGGEVQRLIGAGAGFIFKGSGFYITDYRSKDYKSRAKAEGGGCAKEGCASSGAGDKAAASGAGAKGDAGTGGSSGGGASSEAAAPSS